MVTTAAMLQHVLDQARDDQLTRVVALLDAMPVRGAADNLLAPHRARLAEISPPRPLSLSRLLFIPLEALIISGDQWQSGLCFVPRSLLAPLARAVAGGLGPVEAEISRRIHGHVVDDDAAIDAGGDILWPAAAKFLTEAAPLEECSAAAGLDISDCRSLIDIIAGLLAEGIRLRAVAGKGASASEESLRNLIVSAATRGPLLLAAMMAVLLAQIPENRKLYEIIGRIFGQDGADKERAAIDGAIARFLAESETTLRQIQDMHNMSPAASAKISQAICKLGAMLEGLGMPEARQSAERHRQIGTLRRMLDETCRERFGNLLKSHLLDLIPNGNGQTEISVLERNARELRRFEHAARQIGSESIYDRLLREAGQALATMPDSGADLTIIDRARLIEILVGTEEAMALVPMSDFEAARL